MSTCLIVTSGGSRRVVKIKQKAVVTRVAQVNCATPKATEQRTKKARKSGMGFMEVSFFRFVCQKNKEYTLGDSSIYKHVSIKKSMEVGNVHTPLAVLRGEPVALFLWEE